MLAVDLKPALVFLSGELIAVPIPLDREEVILGRALEADVRVNDTQVSRQHASIRTIQSDDGSDEYICRPRFAKRTYLNGRRVRREKLENGDKITIGETILRFDLLDEIDREYQRQIHRLISHDDLTGLLSSRSFFSELRREAGRATAENRPFCVLMMDGDNFKAVNDTYGHLTGSKTIEEIGFSIMTNLRSGDAAARFRRRRICRLSARRRPAQAIVAAERIRASIESYEFSVVRREAQRNASHNGQHRRRIVSRRFVGPDRTGRNGRLRPLPRKTQGRNRVVAYSDITQEEPSHHFHPDGAKICNNSGPKDVKDNGIRSC